jgi:hypothetical protein
MKTLLGDSPPLRKSLRPDEEYINHLLEECDEPSRLYEHLCWYIHTWGPAVVKPLAYAAHSPKIRRTALRALRNVQRSSRSIEVH